jgi:ArsR family transcriptional regulator, nickel/cobalt-responsive transcriptional repressor
MMMLMGHGLADHAAEIRVTASVAERIAEVMEVLATPSRVHILACLRERPQTVGEIVKAVGMAQSAVSHQLRILRDLGFVVGERQGRSVSYSLHDDHVASLLNEAIYHVEHLDLGRSPQE